MTDTNYAVLIYSKDDLHRVGGVYALTRTEALHYIAEHDEHKCLLHHFKLPYVPYVPMPTLRTPKRLRKEVKSEEQALTLFS
jgi:hypothetical protein